MTYTSKTTHQNTQNQTPCEVSPAGLPLLTANDMEKNGLIDCTPQYTRLAQLHNSAAMISLDGPIEQHAKLTAAISAALKGLETIETVNAKRRDAAAKVGTSDVKNGITDAEFHDDIRVICDLINSVPPEGYKPGSRYSSSAADGQDG